MFANGASEIDGIPYFVKWFIIAHQNIVDQYMHNFGQRELCKCVLQGTRECNNHLKTQLSGQLNLPTKKLKLLPCMIKPLGNYYIRNDKHNKTKHKKNVRIFSGTYGVDTLRRDEERE